MAFPKRALVLAAGFGTRLRPATEKTPKALLSIGGRPMIEYPLRMLAAAGVETVVVNLHHLGEQIPPALGNGFRYGLAIEYSREDPILDTGGAIARVRPFFRDQPFAVANCDTLLDVDLGALAALHEARGTIATLVLRTDPEAERHGALDIDQNGIVRRFLGHPADAPGSLERRMFCGVHVLSPEIFAYFPPQEVFSITRDVYGKLPVGRLAGITHTGYWRDLGTPESLAAADRELRTGGFRPSYIQP